jgi:hypothetical protein
MATTFADALKESLNALGGIRTKTEIGAWIEEHYPNKWKAGTLSGHLYGCRVNDPKAYQHHAGLPKFLFEHGSSRYELYDASRHGLFVSGLPEGEHKSIAEDNVQPVATDSGASTAFAYEEHLRDYLAKNLTILEASLSLWAGSEAEAVEFPIDGRRIDILAKDKSGVPVVIELKVNRGHERTIGQCLYYRAKIKELMKVPRVRIFIVAEEISPELKLATQELSDVNLFEYNLSMTVRKLTT